MFNTIFILIFTGMHTYLFWRAASVPLVIRHLPAKGLFTAALILWSLFLLGRVVSHNGTGAWAAVLEFLGMTWLGTLFLTVVLLLAMDLVTLFGIVMPRLAVFLRGAAIAAGLVLALIALVQGLRPPVVERYVVRLAGLPQDLDGTVIVAVSDTHLGSQIGANWLSARIDQVEALQPDMVVLPGDIVEGHGPPSSDLMAPWRRLAPSLGVWAVLGNHEFYGGIDPRLFDIAGIRLLRDAWAEVRPGLVLAGVDDLTIRYRRGRQEGDPVAAVLADRPAGATILLSHTPWGAESAAKAGVGLMLCGHTHGGQIWPFGYLVRRYYPLFEGPYAVDRMRVIVCRGTGTWGPRMRLWRPGAILHVTLRAGGEGGSVAAPDIQGAQREEK